MSPLLPRRAEEDEDEKSRDGAWYEKGPVFPGCSSTFKIFADLCDMVDCCEKLPWLARLLPPLQLREPRVERVACTVGTRSAAPELAALRCLTALCAVLGTVHEPGTAVPAPTLETVLRVCPAALVAAGLRKAGSAEDAMTVAGDTSVTEVCGA